ncbi:hypothetical protein DRQ33_03175 [bacterium]|nr:MAG: hypothetical protein DRQ33_03175 [bacterium]
MNFREPSQLHLSGERYRVYLYPTGDKVISIFIKNWNSTIPTGRINRTKILERCYFPTSTDYMRLLPRIFYG